LGHAKESRPKICCTNCGSFDHLFFKCSVRKQWVKKGIKSSVKEVIVIDDPPPLVSLHSETIAALPASKNLGPCRKIWVKKGSFRPGTDFSIAISHPSALSYSVLDRHEHVPEIEAAADSEISASENSALISCQASGASQSFFVPTFTSFWAFLGWMMRQVHTRPILPADMLASEMVFPLHAFVSQLADSVKAALFAQLFYTRVTISSKTRQELVPFNSSVYVQSTGPVIIDIGIFDEKDHPCQ
jgi:hypothetical protein